MVAPVSFDCTGAPCQQAENGYSTGGDENEHLCSAGNARTWHTTGKEDAEQGDDARPTDHIWSDPIKGEFLSVTNIVFILDILAIHPERYGDHLLQNDAGVAVFFLFLTGGPMHSEGYTPCGRLHQQPSSQCACKVSGPFSVVFAHL